MSVFSSGDTLNAIVGDIGQYATKIGFAGEDYPRSYFRSVRFIVLLVCCVALRCVLARASKNQPTQQTPTQKAYPMIDQSWSMGIQYTVLFVFCFAVTHFVLFICLAR